MMLWYIKRTLQRWRQSSRQWHFERGYGAACVQLMVYNHPMGYVRDQLYPDGANPSFDAGWLAACNDIEAIMHHGWQE